mgnify:CR=1 FL=1
MYHACNLRQSLEDDAAWQTEVDNFVKLLPVHFSNHFRAHSHFMQNFNGRYHMEELMFRHDMRRAQLQRTIDCWRPFLLVTQHEDAELILT